MTAAGRAPARVAARVRLLAVAATWTLATGCVYYNGIYNAKAAARAGDARLRAGDEGEAATQFQLSAARAESVLVRHPQSSWRPRALYLAGRGAAFGNNCDRAVVRLGEFLAQPVATARERHHARIALAACELRTARIASARARLDSLIDVPDREIASQARMWAARAALADDDPDAVARYLGSLESAPLQWELVNASLRTAEFVRVESLLVQRAARGDYRDDVVRAVRELAAAGQWDAAERIVGRYDQARVGDAGRAAMHYALGDLSLRAGRDSSARLHLFSARTLAGRDTTTAAEAAARLALLGIPRLALLREIDTVIARQDSAVRRTAFARRTIEQLLLVKLLEARPDPTGAALYLAAEVARDSLRAARLARTLFLRVARDVSGSPLAPNAYYAAALLDPDSAPDWHARIRSEHGTSAVAAWLRGDDPGARPDFVTTPQLLQFTWTETIRAWADSVRKLRTPPRPAAPVRTSGP